MLYNVVIFAVCRYLLYSFAQMYFQYFNVCKASVESYMQLDHKNALSRTNRPHNIGITTLLCGRCLLVCILSPTVNGY